MAATQRLELRQSQSLVMTPQLQQAIKLLQLSNQEITAYVEGELEQNPLLEQDDGSSDSSGDLRSSEAESATTPEELPEAVEQDQDAQPDSLDLARDDCFPDDADAPLDTDFANLYNHDSPGTGGDGTPFGATASTRSEASRRSQEDGAPLEQQLSEEISLRQHLLDQLQLTLSDPIDRMIGVHLIDMLDDAGHLKGDLADLALRLGCDLGRLEATLFVMQGFDPTGVFARSLPECLALQLAERNRLDPAMRGLLDNLEMLARGETAALMRHCQVDEEDFSEMLAELRALDPKPALAFDFRPAQAIIPDILMRVLPSGGWALELNSDSLPRVLVNESYYAQVCGSTRSRADRDYINERFQSANWLVKALHQRATTILKVASEIVRQQDGFFRKGVVQLKPLTLKDIAEAIEMHESTVSRVTSNKYIATPRGNYELKYFFGSSIAGANGSAHAAESVRQRIKLLIEREPKNRVLSDDSIVSILRSDGVEIARRTVAKYREALRIPSSVERRRQKAIQA